MDNSFYQVVAQTMGEGLLVVDTAGQILAVNPAFLAMTGYDGSELVGKRCTVLNCTGCTIFGEGSDKQWCGLFKRGGIRDRRCEMTTKDGRTIHIVKHATVLQDEKGEATCAVEILTDVSEMVRKEEEIHCLRTSLPKQAGFMGMVGASPSMQKLFELIENVALSNAPVLIYGESGVGKELVARAVHDFAGGAEKNFIKVNCASLNENLLESELFGHVKGAFTGADRDRMGRFEAASGGSIFLDEIGDISAAIQVKLLRVLESKEIERVGDHRPIPVQVRIITATNKNLEELVAQKLFREDLFYRINVVPIHVPPLRTRKEDIPLLAQTFIDSIAAQNGKPIVGLTPEALETLYEYDWPGNVRELRNAIEYAFVLCNESCIGKQHLPSRLKGTGPEDHAFLPVPGSSQTEGDPRAAKIARERDKLIQVLAEAGGNRSRAAEILGVSRVTVWKRMKKLGIQVE
ncbi:MAG TPA: sigma-54-dependent Fis family transcriptional regulator [Syntrophobacteraceae bacterium]|nr:sigma-54-dependent Fis family transcriptional regulator [Syntrophobacteraceae bacterium]